MSDNRERPCAPRALASARAADLPLIGSDRAKQ
jgi:hypothetical protein